MDENKGSDISTNKIELNGTDIIKIMDDKIDSKDFESGIKFIPDDISLNKIDVSGSVLTIGPSDSSLNILSKLIANNISVIV